MMKDEINLINNVIWTHFGNETEEEYKQYSKYVVDAWYKILNHLEKEERENNRREKDE